MEKVADFLLDKGLAGLAILALGYVVIHLYGRISALQDARIKDIERITEVLNSSASTYQLMSQSMDKRTVATEALGSAQKALTEAIERLVAEIRMLREHSADAERRLERVVVQAEAERREILRMLANLSGGRSS